MRDGRNLCRIPCLAKWGKVREEEDFFVAAFSTLCNDAALHLLQIISNSLIDS